MKRIIAFLVAAVLVALVGGAEASAQDGYKVEVTMKDGTVKTGYYHSSTLLTRFELSETPRRGKQTIDCKDIEQVVALPEDGDTTRVVYVSRRMPGNIAQTKPSEDFGLYEIVYHDDNIEVFVDVMEAPPAMWANGQGGYTRRSMSLSQFKYIRTGDDNDFVHVLYSEHGGRHFLKGRIGKDFPETYAKVESGEINFREVKKDPMILVPFLSAEIAKQKKEAK